MSKRVRRLKQIQAEFKSRNSQLLKQECAFCYNKVQTLFKYDRSWVCGWCKRKGEKLDKQGVFNR